MRRYRKRLVHFAGAGLALSVGLLAPRGSVVVLDFEGLKDLEPVTGFYAGSTGGMGSGPGKAFGVRFSPNALAVIDSDAGGSGNFGGEPSSSTALFFLEPSVGTPTSAATLDVTDGFRNGFSFFYSAVREPGFVAVYDGSNGSGNVLARLDLPLTPFEGAPDPTGIFSPFVPTGVRFDGTARSVDFGGSVNQIAFDNITLGLDRPTPVPETGATAALAVLAVSSLAGMGLNRGARSSPRSKPTSANVSGVPSPR